MPDGPAATKPPGFDIPGASALVRAMLDCPDLPAAVAAHAARTPDKPFLILRRDGHPDSVTSFAHLHDVARAYAAAYRALGVQHGAAIVLMLVADPALAPAFLGAMMAGLVPSIFPPQSPRMDAAIFWAAQQVAFARIGVALIVTDTRNAGDIRTHMTGYEGEVLDVEAVLAATGSDAPIALAPDGMAFLQHSSGTTGAKKGVIMRHRAVLDAVAGLAHALAITDADIIASWLPLYHDMGLIACLMLPMALGLTVVQLDPFDWAARPGILLDAIARDRATLCWMPNFAFHHIMRIVRDPVGCDLSSVRAFIDCSEPCKPATLALFAKRFAPHGLRPTSLQVCYGMAESVFGSTQTPLGSLPRAIHADADAYAGRRVVEDAAPGAPSLAFLSVGVALPGLELRIAGEDGNTLPDRQVGQIVIRGAYVFSGYFRMDMPPGKMRDGWFQTGDLGFIDAGELFVSGRMDDLMIVNGRNIYAHDVEYAVNAGSAVRPGRCVAVGPFNARLGSQSLVIIAESDAPEPDQRAILAGTIRDIVQATFGTAAYDVRITDPGWLVKTTSGKISRGANLRRYLEAFPL